LPAQVGTPAQEVLQALSQFDPELNEIDSAVSNPRAYWPIDYERPFETYLGGITRMIQIAKVIQLKGVAHLDNHEPDLAEKDYLFSLRLNQPLTKGCSVINYLVMIAVSTIDDSILWEGLHRHIWSNAQLHEMESALASIDMLALAATNFRSERASTVQTLKVFHSSPSDLRETVKHAFSVPINILFITASIRPRETLI
jgi:hypothetical protein